MNIQSYGIVLFSLVLLCSCEKESPNSNTKEFKTGNFIVNQGPFQSGTGTISFFSTTDSIPDLYEKQNPNTILGNIAQSMIKVGDYYAIAVNNGSSILVLNANTFTLHGRIQGIANPRYFASDGQFVYVTSWGPDFNSGKIYKLDLSKLSIISEITTGGAPEQLCMLQDNLYVPISTIIDPSNRLLKINANTMTIEKSILLADNPSAAATDKNGRIWVVCSGNSDFVNPANNTPGTLICLSTDTIYKRLEIPNGSHEIAFNLSSDQVFFLSLENIRNYPIDSSIPTTASWAEGSFTSLEFEPSSGNLWATDAGNFQSKGDVVVFNSTKSQLSRFKAGIVPGFIYFAR